MKRSIIKESPKVWSKHLVRTVDDESWFSEDPVFAFVSASDFSEAIVSVPTPTLHIVQQALKERYGHLHEYTKWKMEELPFLQEVHTMLARKVRAHRGPPSLSMHSLKTWFLPSIEKFIEDLVRFQTQLDHIASTKAGLT